MNHLRRLVIYGAGGHGLVVAETAALAGHHVLGFIDDAAAVGEAVGAWRVLGAGSDAGDAAVIVAVGENAARWKLLQKLAAGGARIATVVHPGAHVSTSAKIGAGVFIGAAAVVNGAADLGAGAIVNSGAIVEHHVRLGAACHVGPGATLAGRVVIGDRALIGAGAVVIPGRVVGDDAVVGAGAVVVRDVPAAAKVAGCPARAI